MAGHILKPYVIDAIADWPSRDTLTLTHQQNGRQDAASYVWYVQYKYLEDGAVVSDLALILTSRRLRGIRSKPGPKEACSIGTVGMMGSQRCREGQSC